MEGSEYNREKGVPESMWIGDRGSLNPPLVLKVLKLLTYESHSFRGE